MRHSKAFLGGVCMFLVGAMLAQSRIEKSPLLAAPEQYVKRTNPVANNPDAIRNGKLIFAARCAKCHEADKEGWHAGPSLDTPEVKDAPPGAVYWVLEKGNGKMPSFAQYPEKYRWQIVSFLQRTEASRASTGSQSK